MSGRGQEQGVHLRGEYESFSVTAMEVKPYSLTNDVNTDKYL